MDYLTMDENVCPVCGKVFYTALGRDWGWRYKGNNYCSYHCMRHIEVRHRVRQGWVDRNYNGYVYEISPKAQSVARDMRAVRHLVKAASHLSKAAEEQSGSWKSAIASLQKKVDNAANTLWETHQDAVEQLDGAKRRLATDLFCEAKPLWQVAADRKMDTDLVAVKLCLVYDDIARREE